ncbi:MAG: V-type ATPase subunit, partial [Dehalococcoidia bacterium]
MFNPRYAFISACLKGEEPRVVTPEHIDKMVTASNLQDALTIVRDTDIGSYLEGLTIKTFDSLDEYLWSYLGQRIQYVEAFKFLPKDVVKLSRAYIVRYDVLNIKAALQSIASGKKARMIPVGVIYNSGLLDTLSSAEHTDDIIPLLTRCKLGDYVPALEHYRGDKAAKSRLVAEAKLDGQYYSSMLQMARKIKDGFVLSQA